MQHLYCHVDKDNNLFITNIQVFNFYTFVPNLFALEFIRIINFIIYTFFCKLRLLFWSHSTNFRYEVM